MDDIKARISAGVARDLPGMAPHLRAWVAAHLVEPRLIDAWEDSDGLVPMGPMWLVTDHTGQQDACMRVIFDPRNQSFGLVMGREGEVSWFWGSGEGFAEAVNDI
ncbi:MAG: hypothetical protein HY902_08625 [Deltaproteobacteria bacterium]|nr:hypothetical protein [Deltaproteobacteria bacterium]